MQLRSKKGSGDEAFEYHSTSTQYRQLRRLSKPVLGEHYSIPRGCPLNTGFTVFVWYAIILAPSTYQHSATCSFYNDFGTYCIWWTGLDWTGLVKHERPVQSSLRNTVCLISDMYRVLKINSQWNDNLLRIWNVFLENIIISIGDLVIDFVFGGKYTCGRTPAFSLMIWNTTIASKLQIHCFVRILLL